MAYSSDGGNTSGDKMTPYAVAGHVCNDPVRGTFGSEAYTKCDFNVYVTKGMYPVRCQALFELAEDCALLKKGDRVIVAGGYKISRTEDGKVFSRLHVNTVLLLPDAKGVVDLRDAFAFLSILKDVGVDGGTESAIKEYRQQKLTDGFTDAEMPEDSPF